MFSTDKPSKAILVVDDDQAVGAVIKAILVAGGYDVITAPDGLEAWHMTQEFSGTIGLVITDVMMPNMDGIELSRRLNATHPDLPILLISTFVSPAMVEDLGLQARFLEKPFALQALLDIVQSAFNRSWFSEDQVANAA